MKRKTLDLFGGDMKWKASSWTSSDDRVRGGKSQSYLKISESGATAKFSGNLDIKTLGGAGFASQRTASDDESWDLEEFDGIEIVIVKADDKRYTFNMKDTLLPLDPDTGREQSTISYEYDFSLNPSRDTDGRSVVWVPWDQTTATYRGRQKLDAPKLNTKAVKRFGIMCRSFFGDQEGGFELEIERISAVRSDGESIFIPANGPLLSNGQGRREETKKAMASGEDIERGYEAPNGAEVLEFTGVRRWGKLFVIASVVLVGAWMLCNRASGLLARSQTYFKS